VDTVRGEARYRRRRAAAVGGTLLLAGAIAAAVARAGGSGGAAASTTLTTTSQTQSRTHATVPVAARTVVHDGPHGTESVPILMYHVILPPPPGAPFPGLYVPPAEFAAQMHALAAAGYHAVTMNQVWDNWRHGTPLPKGKPIVLSFDNGYESQWREALPVLESMGWVGVENLQLSGLPPSQGGITHSEVRALIRAGWEIDTQGWNHADLVTLDAAELEFQVAHARRVIRALYHVHADWFCYPSGDYDATVIAAVKAAGFRGSTTVVPGWASPTEDPYRLPRLRVLSGTSPLTLLSEIAAIRGDAAPGTSYTYG
jgi:peptidoglycan/xylan/chitin deacetylase (PgdA/CDA1 family)